MNEFGGMLLPRHMMLPAAEEDQQSESGASLVSVNTRRGWPQVARVAPPQPAVPARGSYLDALLRDPSERQQPSPQLQAQPTPRGGFSSGWTALPRKPRGVRLRARLRGPDIPLCPLEEGVDEEQEVM